MLTMTDYTRTLRPHIPSLIISHRAFDYMLTLTSQMPATLANRIYDFEVYFSGDRSDLAIQFPATEEGRHQLLQLSTHDHPAWQKVARFASMWSEPNSPMYQDIHHAWLSFDVDRPSSGVPVPCIFYCGVSLEKKNDPEATILLLTDLFNVSDDMDLLTCNLMHCLRHIPEGARINEFGFGLLRNRNCIRLQVLGIRPHEIPAYLEAVGWECSPAPLASMLAQIANLDRAGLIIDISASPRPRVYPKIGIECYVDKDHARWETFLDYLVEHQLCPAAHRDFALHFPGIKVCVLGQQVSLTRQRLSHIKIAYAPHQAATPFEAKAYLTNFPDWLSANS